jgi:hypothetical protein
MYRIHVSGVTGKQQSGQHHAEITKLSMGWTSALVHIDILYKLDDWGRNSFLVDIHGHGSILQFY